MPKNKISGIAATYVTCGTAESVYCWHVGTPVISRQLDKMWCRSIAIHDMRHLLVQNQMTADVVGHLRSISGQQSKIRGLRQKLQILREATAKQGTAVSHLLFVRRVPAVYRQCLAEYPEEEGQAAQVERF